MSDELIDRHIAAKQKWWPALDPQRTAVLVVDMQECQVRKESPYFSDGFTPGLREYLFRQVAEVAEPNVIRLVAAAHEARAPVVFTKFSSHDKQGRDLPRHLRFVNERAAEATGRPKFPYQGDPASGILSSLAPEERDIVLVKTTTGVFTSTDLERILKNMGVDHLFICGVLTNACVESSARAAADLGFFVTVVDDACAAWSESAHVASLRAIAMCFGVVAKTESVIKLLLPEQS
jgi:nicotinamidase-related amidase